MLETELSGIGDAAYFETSYGGRSPAFYAGILAEVIKFGRPGSILDLGCGIALLAEYATKWHLDVSGYDGSSVAVSMALERCPTLKVCQAYFSESLPCANEAFDNIVLYQVIEHLPPVVLKQALLESYRVLKKDGVLFVFSPNKGNRREVAKDPTHCNPLYPSELRKHLREAGFNVIREPNSPRFLRDYPFLRGLSRRLLQTKLADWVSATSNAYAVRL
jgi:SAM-dependent methyltransferase